MIGEWKNNLKEFLKLLNVGCDTVSISDIDSENSLIGFLVANNILININEPKSECESVNLFHKIIEIFRENGEELPKYFDESAVCDDENVLEILCFLREYYLNVLNKQIMITDNIRDRYLICIVPKEFENRICTLSFQLGIPLVEIQNY